MAFFLKQNISVAFNLELATLKSNQERPL